MSRCQKRVEKTSSRSSTKAECAIRVCVLVCLCVCTIYVECLFVCRFYFCRRNKSAERERQKKATNKQNDNKNPYEHGLHTFVYCGMLSSKCPNISMMECSHLAVVPIASHKNRRHNECLHISPFTSVCYTFAYQIFARWPQLFWDLRPVARTRIQREREKDMHAKTSMEGEKNSTTKYLS